MIDMADPVHTLHLVASNVCIVCFYVTHVFLGDCYLTCTFCYNFDQLPFFLSWDVMTYKATCTTLASKSSHEIRLNS